MNDDLDLKNGYIELSGYCSQVFFRGYTSKNGMPKTAKRESTDGKFNHRYYDIKVNSMDDCDFWGHIYLPCTDSKTVYMKFEVYA